jgi:hypothetical protein
MLSLLFSMAQREHLERDIAFLNGLLAKDGYHLFLRELLIEARRKMEEELRELDSSTPEAAA